jgi:hypothetical protein
MNVYLQSMLLYPGSKHFPSHSELAAVGSTGEHEFVVWGLHPFRIRTSVVALQLQELWGNGWPVDPFAV